MKPVVDGLVKKYAGRYDIRVMNTSIADPKLVGALAQKYRIQYVPTFVFVASNGSVSRTIVGKASVAQLEAELAKLT